MLCMPPSIGHRSANTVRNRQAKPALRDWGISLPLDHVTQSTGIDLDFSWQAASKKSLVQFSRDSQVHRDLFAIDLANSQMRTASSIACCRRNSCCDKMLRARIVATEKFEKTSPRARKWHPCPTSSGRIAGCETCYLAA